MNINWSQFGWLPEGNNNREAGLAGSFTGVTDNIVWIAGGSNFSNGLPWEGGTKIFHDTIYYFQQRKDKTGLVLLAKRDLLPEPIAYGSSIPVKNGVICLGGQNQSGFSEKVLLATIEKTSVSLHLKSLPDLPLGLANTAGAFYNNKIYIAGGESINGPTNQLLSLDIYSGESQWQSLARLPIALSHAVMVAQKDGKDTSLYLIGGRRKDSNGVSELYASVFKYNITTNQWISSEPLPYALSAQTGIAFGENNILIFGGDRGEVFHQVERMLNAINKETDPLKKAKLIVAKNELQTTHPGFSRDVLLYNTFNNKWTKLNPIPFPTPVTTTAFLWNKNILIPTGEIKAGVRTPQLLLGEVSYK